MPRKGKARKRTVVHIKEAIAKIHFGTKNAGFAIVVPIKKLVAALGRRGYIE
jgi:hypothetical protein